MASWAVNHTGVCRLIACKVRASYGRGWTEGRSKGYPYYFCQNKKCELGRKSIPRDQVEGRFEALLRKLSPSSDLVALATDIFRTTWHSRALSAHQTRIQLHEKRARLGDRSINSSTGSSERHCRRLPRLMSNECATSNFIKRRSRSNSMSARGTARFRRNFPNRNRILGKSLEIMGF